MNQDPYIPFVLAIGLILLVLSIFLFFLPIIIACNRRHTHKGGIIALNLVFGWTLLGWGLALVVGVQRH